MKYKDESELINALINETQSELNKAKIASNRSTLKGRHIANIIIKTCDIKRIYLDDDKYESIYVIYNYFKNSYDSSSIYLRKLINIICKELVMDLTQSLIYNIDAMISEDFDIPEFNQAPYYLLKFNNGILNFKTKEFINNSQLKHNVFKYDYLTSSSYNFTSYDNQSNEMKDCVNEMFAAWSNNKDDELKFLLQICAAALDGDGRGKFIILQSPGGDGKSSFLAINTLLASPRNTVSCNLDELNNDNILNQIDLSTKVIKGDDLITNFKLAEKYLSNLKSLTSYEYIQVSRKYLDNKKVRTKALIIQNTNTNVKFFENSSAINRRMIYKIWPAKDFHSHPKNLNGYKLSDLLKPYHPKHQLFMETIISLIYGKLDYFDEFTVPIDTNEINELMMSQSDSVYQFIEHLKEIEFIQYQPYILMRPLYAYYKNWIRINNPGAKIQSSRTFINKFIESFSKDYNISRLDGSHKRCKFYTLSQFNIYQLFEDSDFNDHNNYKSLIYNEYESNQPTIALINHNIQFNSDLIKEIKSKLSDFESIQSYLDLNIIEVHKAFLELIDEKDSSTLQFYITKFDNGLNTLKQISPSELKEILKH